MSMKTKLTMAVAASMFVLAGAASAPAQETLKWLTFYDNDYGADLMDEVTAKFEAQTGIKVERTVVTWNNMYDQLLTNAQGGTATYDVLAMEACCWAAGIDKLAGLEPLDDYLAADPEFAAKLTDMTTPKFQGRSLLLNWVIFPYSYVYNVDLYAKAGLTPPNNWAEMVERTKQLTESGAAQYGFVEGFAGDVHHVPYYIFGSRLAQLGGKFLDENGRAIFNSEAGVQALTDWKAFYDAGLMFPGAIGMMTGEARETLAAGTAAAMMDGPFSQPIAQQANPDIRLAYAPAWKEKTGGYVWSGSGLSISANSTKKDAAWQFIKFLLSDENSVYLTEKTGVPFATKAAMDSITTSQNPILKEIPAMLNQDPAANFFTTPIPEQETLHREFVVMFQEVMAGNKEPKAALDELAAFWNETFGL